MGNAQVVGLVAALVLAPRLAHAYIDPGTGNLVLQALIAAVAGGLVATRRWWAQLRRVFRRTRDVGKGGAAD